MSANKEEQAYLDLLNKILTEGKIRKDRTGIGTLSLFGTRLDFDLSDWSVPLLTTKEVYAKGVIEELSFFIRGETQTKTLEAKGVNIWRGNTNREFLDKKGFKDYTEGEMGPMYGAMWRKFSAPVDGGCCDAASHAPVDQLQNCFDLITNDPYSRRIMMTAYNPQASKYSVLDPCHFFIQFYVSDGKLSSQFQMRSVDTFLGLPFNLTSYAILTCIMAKATKLSPGKLIFVGGDTHLYLSHIEQAKEQITRKPYNFPKLNITKEINSVKDMESLTFNDFEIIDYKHYPKIAAKMAV